jgi:hypothetical protein
MEKEMKTARHSKRSRLFSGAAVLGLCLVAAGCGPVSVPVGASKPDGSSSSNSGGGVASAACNLFTDAEISTAAGRQFTKHGGVDAALLGQSICTYQGSDESKPLQSYIFYNQKAMQLYLMNESAGEHIASLGDDAFWVPEMHALFVRKGDHALYIVDIGSVTLSAEVDSSQKDAFVALARKALPKI